MIQAYGKTLAKLYPDLCGKSLVDHFRVVRPDIPEQSFQSFKSLTNQMVVIECNNKQRTTLRGQIEYLKDSNGLMFIGSPWFGSVEQVIENNLSLHDFAYHDPMIDLLHVLKTQEITTEDLKHLLKTVNKQKNDLKKAAKEIEDIALFPTQNPDPLIRIDLNGNLLRQNPAADLLTHFDYQDGSYTASEFWRLIARTFDSHNDRTIFEAGSFGEIYSFVIKPIQESGYFNIYGRKVTEQKKNEVQLQILSSIAAQNTHGVVIADSEGKIEWANPSFERMTGYKLEEIIGRKPGELLQGPDSDPETIQYLSNQIAKGEPFICEILNYTKDRKPYWLRIQGQALRDEKGNIGKYFAIEEDVTQEREDKKKIQEFEDRFRMALEKIGDYVWERNFVTGHTQFSKKENHFIGVSTEELEKNEILWRNSVLEEDRHLLEESNKNYKSGLADNHVLEYRLRHQDGSVKWVLDRGVVIEKDVSGNPLLIIGTHTDITRQKTLELELGSTASRLTSLIENLYSGVLLENENHTIGLLNQQFCDIFHITANPKDLIGTDCSQAAEQSKHLFKDPNGFADRITQILVNKTLVINEHLEMIDGKHLHRDFIPIWNGDSYTGHLWLYTDITEQINADKKLEKQRTFYEQILNNMPADIAVFDNQHRYLFLNPQAISNSELRSWMIGKRDEDYIAYKNLPASIVERRRKIFNTAIEKKQLHSFEEELLKPDGSSIYILRNLYPILNENGEVDLVVGYGIDITALKIIQNQIKESEKRYRDVIENSLALITTHDLDGNFISVNPMVGKTYGYTDEEMIGHSIADFLPESDRELFDQEYLPTIMREKEHSGIFKVQSKNGKTVFTLYNNFLKEEPGMDPYVIGFAVDISDRIQAEKELKIAKKATDELATAKHNFLANMSHEIRTPMNAIIGMSNQLNKTALSSQQKIFLNNIHTAADNLLVIINDILDLSKLDAGKLSIEHIAFEPRKLIEGALQALMYKAEEKDIELTNSYCDPGLSEVLIGDPHRLNQVLLNLISNAVKFTDRGNVDLICEVILDSTDVQLIRVKLIDTGVGMDEAFLKTLFDKFSQEDVSVSRSYGGTGLGMAITQSILHLMGGTIQVNSKKNEGTVVIVEIELRKGNADLLLVNDTQEINTDVLINRKVLVVDDNEMNRFLASTILENHQVDVMEAENGEQAVMMARQLNPEIILMDLQMPILNGWEATQTIRESGNNIPIIALTANAIKGENEKCFTVGMNDYISKPYKENELLQKLVKWLSKKPLSTSSMSRDTKPMAADEDLYSLVGLEEISRGNHAFVKKMINLFCDQTPLMVADLIQAYHAGDFKKMGAVAHKMKPSIDNLRITAIKQDIRTIEKAGKETKSFAGLEASIFKVQRTIEGAVQQMKQGNLKKN
ncbi:MAG: PAS domain S-box protein [Saprospiraceae bacterium]|nr:PAS domain S-box protein [Saprospiraceae bacterium]